MRFLFISVSLVSLFVLEAHKAQSEIQVPLENVENQYTAYRGEDTVTSYSIFSGITTFARLPWVQCLGMQEGVQFDIAFLGAPFDTGTSYRPGARFGPAGIRAGSRRTGLGGPYNVPLDVNAFENLTIVDCGDIPVTPYDSAVAIKQIEDDHKELLHRTPVSKLGLDAETGQQLVSVASDGKEHPRIITLGGDHTIVLPILRSIHSAYGAISVIHFDSHLDTWIPSVFGGATTHQAEINHGTYFYWASKEGLIKNGTSVHGAIRTTLYGLVDYENDDASGFRRIEAREIETIGKSHISILANCTDGIIKKIHDTIGINPVYLSIDIDAIDPAFAPATGTPETGGWTTRELRAIIRGLDGLRIVSADIVEVAPAYDTKAEITSIAAADVRSIFYSTSITSS
ncbi:hypothetical protein EW145_g3326 [Phellinidium pouzarii]|uniref:Agmatinase n=1 Tax=Phellinidium pouzarii TaxID=167371 RepID=A0A4S4L9G0_9AGAM|nr:hypothetical protein EW145_g3326 [Phellinidium pouzarii]